MRRTKAGIVATVVAAAGLAGSLWLVKGKEKPVAVDNVVGGVGTSEITPADLEKVARTRVFFGHQSVGNNILGGVPVVFADHGVTAPPIEERRTAPVAAPTGFIAHALVGENTKPREKIQDFAAMLRGGTGAQVDVAVLKLCYVDITPDTDVDALFAEYRDTVAALEKDFPDVTFVKATVPLTTEPDLFSKVKLWVKRNDGYGGAANSTRERLNQLIRQEYRGDHLFDVAAVESTGTDGSRAAGHHDGQPYFALADGYAADPGHLNDAGSQRVATAWLAAIARASGK